MDFITYYKKVISITRNVPQTATVMASDASPSQPVSRLIVPRTVQMIPVRITSLVSDLDVRIQSASDVAIDGLRDSQVVSRGKLFGKIALASTHRTVPPTNQ